MSRKPKLELVKSPLPHWLLPPRPKGAPVSTADLDFIFECLTAGHTMTAIFRDNPTLPSRAKIMEYIHDDPSLSNRYFKCKKIAAEFWIDTATDRLMDSDEDAIPQEIEKTKAQVSHLWRLASVYNRKQYGESKSLTINGQVDIGAAMAKADQRVETGVTVDHEGDSTS